jgi:hypothetical protein
VSGDPATPDRSDVPEAQARRLVAILSAVATSLAAVVFLSSALIAAVHADGSYNVHQVSGVWLALAQDVRDGLFYPPLYDGHFFGGTRYMPGQILAYAGAAEAVGDPVIGAKLSVYAAAVALLALLLVSLRLIGCSLPVAAALAAAALATGVGLLAATAVGGDTWPVVLQLGALLLILRREGRGAAAGAGVICALAILTKVTALWAPAAVVVWLATRDRRRLAAFAIALAMTLAVGFAASEAASDGRFSDNIVGLSGSSFEGFDFVVLDSPGKLLTLAHDNATAIVILFPLVAVSLALAVDDRLLSLYDLSFVFALVLLLVVLADQGAYYNHLLDVCVLSVLVVGELWRRTAGSVAGYAMLRVVVLAAVVWALVLGYYTDVKPAAAEAARLLVGRADRDAYSKQPPQGTIGRGDDVLSDDPYVPVSLDHRPVVLDAFQLLRIADEHPDWRRALVRRLDAHEFDKVVVLERLDHSAWWRDTHFGLPVVDAIRRNYRLSRRLPDWRNLWIYVPRTSPTDVRRPTARRASSRREASFAPQPPTELGGMLR